MLVPTEARHPWRAEIYGLFCWPRSLSPKQPALRSVGESSRILAALKLILARYLADRSPLGRERFHGFSSAPR